MSSEGFLYWQCPDCGWDTVLHDDKRVTNCPLCESDSGRHVILRWRQATSDDHPEGPDERRTCPLTGDANQ